MGEIIIRDYRSSDFPLIFELWMELGLGSANRGDDAFVVEKTLRHGGFFLVMERENGQVIGTSWTTNDGRRLYLHHFGIAKKHQGKGLSKNLLQKTLARAKEIGLQIKLEVSRENNIATNLYKKYGFIYLGDYDTYIIREYNDQKLNRG